MSALMSVHNRLKEIRQNKGLSVAKLADLIGVKRQTIYAIEASNYVPNTLITLRLAKVLDVAAEELFHLDRDLAAADKRRKVDLLVEGNSGNSAGRPVQLCSVSQRLVAVPASPVLGILPPADAIILKSRRGSEAIVETFHEPEGFENRLLIAGCDPAMPLLARFISKYRNLELITAECSSLQALHWLKENQVHVAGTHLPDEVHDGAALTTVARLFPESGYRGATFAIWEEGLVVLRGNPKRISSARELGRKNVRIINRQKGSGSRLLLDTLLAREGMSPQKVSGYNDIAQGHILAAWAVHTRRADCCIATRAAARVLGLDFVPLATERYDLIIPDRYWEMPAVQIMLDVINRSAFKHELQSLGGYDTSQTGRIFR
jgi:putative molybdopterin biosynthesis protein